MADANMTLKTTALKLLVTQGILTEDEYDKCITAISGNTSIEVVKSSSSPVVLGGCVYEDHWLKLTFKGVDRVSNLFFGDGYSFKFIIENKSSYEMRITMTEITLNGFVVSNSELLCSEAAGNKKTIDHIYLYDNKNDLDDCDVYCIDDMEDLELRIEYEIKELGIENESSLIYITPFEA